MYSCYALELFKKIGQQFFRSYTRRAYSKCYRTIMFLLSVLPSNHDSNSLASWSQENERRVATLDKSELARRGSMASPVPQKKLYAHSFERCREIFPVTNWQAMSMEQHEMLAAFTMPLPIQQRVHSARCIERGSRRGFWQSLPGFFCRSLLSPLWFRVTLFSVQAC
jgi:hypothetical protein